MGIHVEMCMCIIVSYGVGGWTFPSLIYLIYPSKHISKTPTPTTTGLHPLHHQLRAPALGQGERGLHRLPAGRGGPPLGGAGEVIVVFCG